MGVPLHSTRFQNAKPSEQLVLLPVRAALERIRAGLPLVVLRSALRIEQSGRRRKGLMDALAGAIVARGARP